MIQKNNLPSTVSIALLLKTRSSVILSVLLLAFTSTTAVADQIVVADSFGSLLSMAETEEGVRSIIEVTLKSQDENSSAKGARVSLSKQGAATPLLTLTSSESGVVSFANVAKGKYTVSAENSAVQIASVVIRESGSKPIAQGKETSRNIYAAGAATVVGSLAAVAIANSSGSSGSSDSSGVNVWTGLPDGGPRDGSGFTAPGSANSSAASDTFFGATAAQTAQPKPKTSAVVAPILPAPFIPDPNFPPDTVGPPIPAPGTGMVGGVPSFGDSGNPPTGGGNAETPAPPAPGDVNPPPIPGTPMTPPMSPA